MNLIAVGLIDLWWYFQRQIQAEPVSDYRDFYVDAKRAVDAGVFDQSVEDGIDDWMARLNEEDEEIEAILAEEDVTDGTFKRPQMEILPSEFTEFAIRIPVAGDLEPFSFATRRYLKPVYDTPARRTLLKCARQTEKSTSLGNKSLAYCGINYGFKVLYVSATATQAQVFSVDRIKEPLDISPEMRFLIDTRLNQNVLFKQFKNRSQIRIRYAFLNADRTRGIPADMILIDEFQDILFANVPVIEQCASHSYWKLYCYSGTPKSLDNSIEVYWSNYSTQNEWMVPCERHGHPGKPHSWFWNNLGIKNIGKKGLICAKCGQSIDPTHPSASWASRQPVTEDNAHRVTFEGYRISQLMVPWISWQDDVIMALERYGTAKFYNEVLGLSYDSGVRPLTRTQVQSCCQNRIRFGDVIENAQKCHGGVFVGIDWGTGEQASYTVVALGGYMGNEFQIFYVHRFTGEDLEPQRQLQMIAKLLVAVNFKIIGADYGGGFDRNDFLQRNFGTLRLAKYQYAGSPKAKVKWQPKLGRFILHRTEIMSDIFNALKYKKIYLPNWEEFATPHGDDMLNIFSEYNDQLNMIQYKLSPGKSDDTFHAVLYCFLVSMLMKPRPDIIIPLHAGHVDFNRR